MTDKEIALRQEISEAESKDKLVLEYLDLCIECTEPLTSFRRRHEILDRLEQIRESLGMDKIKGGNPSC